MKCTDCHGMGPAERSMPNHQLCSVCHQIDEDAERALKCSYCHTRADNTVDDLPKFFADEVKFAHESHREKKCSDCHPRGDILKRRMPDDPGKSDAPQMPTCKLCHPDPDTARFVADPAMPLCVKCHQSMDESRSKCTICHTTMEFCELAVDGDSEDTKWAIWAGNNYYRIGEFDGKTFTLIDDPPYDPDVVEGKTSFNKHRLHYGSHLASQVFNNIPDGQKIKMHWVSYPTPKPPYNQHFSFPVSLSLRTTEDGIRMFAQPIAEIANLRKNTHTISAQPLPSGVSRSTKTSGVLFDIRAEFEVGDAEQVVISGNGLNITYDAIKKTLNGCPAKPLDGKIRIQAIVDNSIIEITGNDGRIMIHGWHGQSVPVDEIRITAHGGNAHLNSFRAHELNSIWGNSPSRLPP